MRTHARLRETARATSSATRSRADAELADRLARRRPGSAGIACLEVAVVAAQRPSPRCTGARRCSARNAARCRRCGRARSRAAAPVHEQHALLAALRAVRLAPATSAVLKIERFPLSNSAACRRCARAVTAAPSLVRAARAARAVRASPRRSSPATASRCRAPARRPRSACVRAQPRPRCSAERCLACTKDRATRRRRKAHVLQRREDGAARADDDVDLAARAACQASKRSRSESAECSTATRSPKAASKRARGLRRRARSRERARLRVRPRARHAFDSLEVDLRLTAAGHPVEQHLLESRRVKRAVDASSARALLRRRPNAAPAPPRAWRRAGARHEPLAHAPRAQRSRDHAHCVKPASTASARRMPARSRTSCGQRCGLLAARRGRRPARARAYAAFSGPRIDQPAHALERAAAHERLDVAQQRRAIAVRAALRDGAAAARARSRRRNLPRSSARAGRHRRKTLRVGCRRRARSESRMRGTRRASTTALERFTERAEVVLGDEAREMQARLVECARHIETFAHAPQRRRAARLLAHRRDDEPEYVARPERNANDVADAAARGRRHRR